MALKSTTRLATPEGLWRPVVTLGLTQIIGFGSIFYAFGVLVTPMSADLGVSPTFAYGILSVALLAGALTAPLAGRLIDRRGARWMMAAGSLACAMAFAVLSRVQGGATLAAALVVMELIAPLVLYDAAFAALAQAVGEGGARRAITLMTMLGGFASTVFWPLTLALSEAWGWRATWLAFGALHLLVCLPLHLSLPHHGARLAVRAGQPPAFAPLPAALHGRAMTLLALAFAVSWAVMAAFSAQWVPILGALGISQTAAVAAGALMGPSQVGARLLEMMIAGQRHPMASALFAMGCLALAVALLAIGPASVITAAGFAVLFGVGQGLATMVRGTVPLALFGLGGYAARLGRLASLRMLVAAVAPFAMAGSVAAFGAGPTLALTAALALASLILLTMIPWRVRG